MTLTQSIFLGLGLITASFSAVFLLASVLTAAQDSMPNARQWRLVAFIDCALLGSVVLFTLGFLRGLPKVRVAQKYLGAGILFAAIAAGLFAAMTGT